MDEFDEGFIADTGKITRAARGHQFDLLLRSPRTQVVLASLPPGHTSQSRPSVNSGSDQIVYLIEGEAAATLDGVDHALNEGQLLLISAGQSYQVTNTGSRRLLYLNFFAGGSPTKKEETL